MNNPTFMQSDRYRTKIVFEPSVGGKAIEVADLMNSGMDSQLTLALTFFGLTSSLDETA